VSLTLEESFSNELLEHLRNERIDVAFIRSPPADLQGLVINSLLNEELVVALPNNHVLARSGGRGNAALPMKALAGETFIIVGSLYGLGLYVATVAACRAAGFNPKVGQEAPVSHRHLIWLPSALVFPSFRLPCGGCTWTVWHVVGSRARLN
jgi:DNA-binding transcriptional LysR family regulator